MSAWTYLKADIYRQHGRSGALLTLREAIRNRSFRVVATARLCQAANNTQSAGKLLLPACKLLHRCAASLAGVDFPWHTKIGAGFALTHGWGMVVWRQLDFPLTSIKVAALMQLPLSSR